MSAWAETSVKEAGNPLANPYPPEEGEYCGGCQRPFKAGERVFRLCKPDEIRVLPAELVDTDPWVCESCLSKPDPRRQLEDVLMEQANSIAVDEWPYPDEDPPDPL